MLWTAEHQQPSATPPSKQTAEEFSPGSLWYNLAACDSMKSLGDPECLKDDVYEETFFPRRLCEPEPEIGLTPDQGHRSLTPELTRTKPQDVPRLNLAAAQTCADRTEQVKAHGEGTPQTARRSWNNVVEDDATPKRPWHSARATVKEISVAEEEEGSTSTRRPWRQQAAAGSDKSLKEAAAKRPWRRKAKAAASISEDMSTLKEMREQHREMRERIAQNPTPVSLLQEHNQKMSDMKMQMNQDMENLRRNSQQVSANLRTVMKQDAAALREDHQPEMIQKVIAELTSAHESARKAEHDSHRWDLAALNKKLEVSKESTALLEKQVNNLKSELKTVAMKDKKAAASASELKHLRDQFGVQQRKLDRKTSEMEECKRELSAKTAENDDLEIQVSEFAEQTRLATCSVQASKEETKSKQAEIEALHDTVHGLRQELDRKQSEIEAGQRTAAEANARADASDDQVRKLTAQLKESEEKRKCLILELESVQMALDEANARAARAETLAKQTQRLLKEEIDAAEEGKQRQRVEIEARFQAMMEASEQKRRTQQSLLEVRKKEVANANARAKKYADYAKKVQNSLKTALSDKSEEAAREAAIAGSEFFFHHFD